MNNKETFNYTYSAKEQEEIRTIRNKYSSPAHTEDKMARLRRLDASVTKKATTVSLVLGIMGALIMGLGMSLVMTDLGNLLGTTLSMAVGIGVGLAGVIMVSLAYPVYNRTLKTARRKIAPEILRLTEELMK